MWGHRIEIQCSQKNNKDVYELIMKDTFESEKKKESKLVNTMWNTTPFV
jgi:hypothetical protein